MIADNISLTSKYINIIKSNSNYTPINQISSTIAYRMRYYSNKQSVSNQQSHNNNQRKCNQDNPDYIYVNNDGHGQTEYMGYGYQHMGMKNRQQLQGQVASHFSSQQQQQQQQQQYHHEKQQQQDQPQQWLQHIDYEQYNVDELMRELVLFMRDKQVRSNMRFDISERITKILDAVKQSKQQQHTNSNMDIRHGQGSKFHNFKQKELKLLNFNNNQRKKLMDQDEIIIQQLQNTKEQDRLFKTGIQQFAQYNNDDQNNQKQHKIIKSKSSQSLRKVLHTKTSDKIKQQTKPLQCKNLNLCKKQSKGNKVKASIICYNPQTNSQKQNRSASKDKKIQKQHKIQQIRVKTSAGTSGMKKQRFNTGQSCTTIQKGGNFIDTGRMNVTAFTVRSSHNNNNPNKQHIQTNNDKSKSKDQQCSKIKYSTKTNNVNTSSISTKMNMSEQQQQRNWSSKPATKIDIKNIKGNIQKQITKNQSKSNNKINVNNEISRSLNKSKSKSIINQGPIVNQKVLNNIRRAHTQHALNYEEPNYEAFDNNLSQCIQPVSHLPSTHFTTTKQKSQTQLKTKNNSNQCFSPSQFSQLFSNPGSTSGSLNATGLMACLPHELSTFPFLQRIQSLLSMQENVNRTASSLDTQIKRLRGSLALQKLGLQQSTKSIHSLQQQLKTIQSSKSSAEYKSQQSRTKALNITNQLKLIQQSINQTKQRNEETVALVAEERQLIDMYKTVIEEVKGQYKIEVQARDQIKRSLLREKKSEGVSRIKADSKERLNTSILTNLKDSLEKWDI